MATWVARFLSSLLQSTWLLSQVVLSAAFLSSLLLGTACDDRGRGAVGGDAAGGDGSLEDGGESDGARSDVEGPDPIMDAACATATSEAEVSLRPVDIIWVVDNSTSMEPAINQLQEGLDDFADLVAQGGLDYRVIMLSLKGRSSSSRFPVCIPRPLAGDDSCGDSERFFHVSVDIASTQAIEQLIGTLALSRGYEVGDDKGSDRPWRSLLRDEATKTIVVATDDNQRTCDVPCAGCSRCMSGEPRLTATSLEDFPGGENPFNRHELGPGILTDAYGALFEGYTFNAIYGWGSENDPGTRCEYPDNSNPPSAGPTYTALVERTNGVRAQICDQADSSAWESFFDAVATRVEETARIECELTLPDPPEGMMLAPNEVNVYLRSGGTSAPFFKVTDADACGAAGGWFYDNDEEPTQVILCPASCDDAHTALRDEGSAGVDVVFGCDTLLI